MNSSKVSLSEASVKRVVDLCDTIRRQSSTNKQSVEMAQGIADYVQKYSCLSEKQAVWICRNADYWKVKRPKELINTVVDQKPQLENASAIKMIPSLTDDIGKQILRGLRRIEKLLESQRL